MDKKQQKTQKNKGKIQNNKQTSDFKRKYFEFYDDIKSPTHDVYDW